MAKETTPTQAPNDEIADFLVARLVPLRNETLKQVYAEFWTLIHAHDQALKSQLLAAVGEDAPENMTGGKETSRVWFIRGMNEANKQLRQAINTVYRGVE